MANRNRSNAQHSFETPLPPILAGGVMLAAVFFASVYWGPLGTPMLRRYATNHPVAIASISLFFIGLATIATKWLVSVRQLAGLGRAVKALQLLIDEGHEVPTLRRPEWLLARLHGLSASLLNHWLIQRIVFLLDLQVHRGQQASLESDLEKLADAEAQRQHDSYSLIRIINWAMPMLGFLGTVLGISQTLGQLDTELLATQQQEAMNQLTAGLYVAFDTTATALVLTVALMFLQFTVNRLENRLLTRLDTDSHRLLITFLAIGEESDRQSLLAPIQRLCEEMVEANVRTCQQQAELFARAIAEQESRWTDRILTVTEGIGQQFSEMLSQSLTVHLARLHELQQEHAQYFDSRWKQWQTDMSTAARQLHQQQQALTKHTSALEQLTRGTADLKRLEESILETAVRLEHLKTIEEASICVAEAVAVLATSLEHAGIVRGPVSVRPRPARPRSASSPTPPLGQSSTNDQAVDPRRSPATGSSEQPKPGKAA
ncbi:MAG: biopolymer transporter [Pirellulaceae bacterium]|nr:MAG: biopolymer transporter [Pirellulaceae bacterium]